MTYSRSVKWTNRIAMIGVLALIYWVFIFMVITIFDLKIFREKITELFLFSILGIVAILAGALVINIMSNLSHIAESLERGVQISPPSAASNSSLSPKAPSSTNSSKAKWGVALVVGLIVIPIALFMGNNLSAKHKKQGLIQSAEKLMTDNQTALQKLSAYKFDREYEVLAAHELTIMTKLDKHFPNLALIQQDDIEGRKVFLQFSSHAYHQNTEQPIQKSDFIFSTTQNERDYLEKVFASQSQETLFFAKGGNYELYVPIKINGKIMVMYLSDYQRYGKLGSS